MIQEIFGYFLIGIIGMFVLAICWLPIGFALRKRISFLRQTAYFLFGVCVLVIAAATFLGWIVTCLLDGRAVPASVRTLNLIPFRFVTESWTMGVRKQITQTIANILMFFPLGLITPVAFKKARSIRNATVAMMIFSFCIEFIQYFIGRSADIDDWMLNVFGGCLGYLVFRALEGAFRNKSLWERFNGNVA